MRRVVCQFVKNPKLWAIFMKLFESLGPSLLKILKTVDCYVLQYASYEFHQGSFHFIKADFWKTDKNWNSRVIKLNFWYLWTQMSSADCKTFRLLLPSVLDICIFNGGGHLNKNLHWDRFFAQLKLFSRRLVWNFCTFRFNRMLKMMKTLGWYML